jgi:hypothetical protein
MSDEGYSHNKSKSRLKWGKASYQLLSSDFLLLLTLFQSIKNKSLLYFYKQDKKNSMGWVRKRTIPTDRRLLSKLVPTFADRVCHKVSVSDP